MKGEKKEIWMHLCEQAAVEQDPDKLMELIKQINQLLEEKERRLTGNAQQNQRSGQNPAAKTGED